MSIRSEIDLSPNNSILFYESQIVSQSESSTDNQLDVLSTE